MRGEHDHDFVRTLARRSTMTDVELAQLLPTLDLEQRIATVIAKYVGGAVSRHHDGETEAPTADARIAAYLLRKMKPWLLQAQSDPGSTD